MGKLTVEGRIKALRKDLKHDKKKRKNSVDEIYVSDFAKRQRKERLKQFTPEYQEHLKTLPEEAIDQLFENMRFINSFPSEDEIFEREMRREEMQRKTDKEFQDFAKKKGAKSLAEYEALKGKYEEREKKIKKHYKKKGLNFYDVVLPMALDEDKMIKNIKRINKENMKRTDTFLAYVDKLYKGEDLPEAFEALTGRVDKVNKATKAHIKSLETHGLNPVLI